MALHKTVALSAVAAGIMLSLGAAQATPLLGATEATTIKASDLAAKEKALTDFPLMTSVKSSIQTLPNSEVEKIEPGLATNPANVKRVESILSEKDWEYLFPMRAAEYTYSNFLKAIGKFPAVCGTYTDGRDSDAICRKSLATMFLPTLLRKPVATKAGAIFPSGARRWFISVKWAGLRVRKAATTGSVTRISGRGRPGPAVKIKTATT